jgi:hypothetical protein
MPSRTTIPDVVRKREIQEAHETHPVIDLIFRLVRRTTAHTPGYAAQSRFLFLAKYLEINAFGQLFQRVANSLNLFKRIS